jgi:hypothetical protein
MRNGVRGRRALPGPCPGLALALAAIIAAMPTVVEELEKADGQRLVRIVSLEASRRFELIDPGKSPPPYWPH